MSDTENGLVLLDDSEYFVQHNVNYPPTAGNGFLMRRCAVSMTSPEGAECVGGYDLTVDGKWHAQIQKPLDRETDTDCRELGAFESRNEALHALWTHRHEALTRHPRH
ncbi:hypothetical protein [Paraburkholderia sp. C35]|uniref:hypothetical protein n=1 Tax=Paraburkholderia sp. C35 TaxID=2126993 RepID=UPI000D690866|nr:hypothetical protein [Paraburkholderia sp. C35]